MCLLRESSSRYAVDLLYGLLLNYIVISTAIGTTPSITRGLIIAGVVLEAITGLLQWWYNIYVENKKKMRLAK
jgi:hypothetical protein